MKHVGMVKNTGKKCVVVFREIYNESGRIVEPDQCLVVELENLPDHAYQDIVSIVESESAQRTGNLYDVLGRQRLSDGNVALNWLHSTGRLRKYATNNVDMITSNSSTLNLSTLNRIIQLQKDGRTEKEIESIIANDTDAPPRKFDGNTNTHDSSINQSNHTDAVLTDADLAKSYLAQSKTMLEEAERLKQQAYELDPSLKKTRKTTTKSKANSTVSETN